MELIFDQANIDEFSNLTTEHDTEKEKEYQDKKKREKGFKPNSKQKLFAKSII
jgi:hypothetical protein